MSAPSLIRSPVETHTVSAQPFRQAQARSLEEAVKHCPDMRKVVMHAFKLMPVRFKTVLIVFLFAPPVLSLSFSALFLIELRLPVGQRYVHCTLRKAEALHVKVAVS